MPAFIVIIVVGFVAGSVAQWLFPGPNKTFGFIMTTVLGIAGAFLATYVGRALGILESNQVALVVGPIIGAIIILFIWNRLIAYVITRRPDTPTSSKTPQSRQK